MDTLKLLEKEAERCQALYDAHRQDSFLSHCYQAQLEATLELAEKMRRGETILSLLAFLRAELPRLEQEAEKEAEHPSFDWYDTHYHSKLLLGRADAYRAILKILEDGLSASEFG